MRDIAKNSGPQAAREWADKNYPADVRDALSQDLEKLSKHYTDRAQRIYARIDAGIDQTAMLLSVLAGLAVVLAIAGTMMICAQRGAGRSPRSPA